jgi:signal transduction histidine kinase
MMGQRLEMLMPERFRTRHISHRADFHKDPKARPMGTGLEVMGRRKDGSEFPVEISLNPVRTAEGLVVATTIADISERKRLEEHARQAAILEERNRVAREVHDTLAQGLAGIIFQLVGVDGILGESPEEARAGVARAIALARANLEEARRSLMALRTTLLPKENLPNSIQHLTAQLSTQLPIEVNYTLIGSHRPLRKDIEENLYRIGQEALNNVRKHSQATRVAVELSYVDSRIQLVIHDNGLGFSGRSSDGQSKFGLAIMRERAESIGAELTFKSGDHNGTRVELSIPISSGDGV